eukprot:scaffold20909_cov114-Attheya_sp.AAC.1
MADQIANRLLPSKEALQTYPMPMLPVAVASIDPVTNLTELIRIDGKTATHIGAKFEQGWLSRYPRPMQCIHDNGGEFTGEHFQLRLQTNGIKDHVPTTVKNPQANSICE